MIEIRDDFYAEVASALTERIGTAEFFNGSVEIDHRDVNAVLRATLIIHRRTVTAPDGERRPISDVVPVWWEFHTTGARGEELNDFSFGELKPFLTEND